MPKFAAISNIIRPHYHNHMQSLDDLLSHHSLVTFRYYAQHAGLPVTDAKEALPRVRRRAQG